MVSCILNSFFLSKALVIKVFIKEYDQSNFNLRYTLTDKIEANEIGKIIEEGFGEGYFQITLEFKSIFPKIRKVKLLLKALGLKEGQDFIILRY